MILFSIAVAYVFLKILVGLVGEQDKRHSIKVEQDRQRRELREALRQNARMR